MKLFSPLVALALCLACLACSPPRAELPAPREGAYAVSGSDPGGLAPYEGRTVLTRLGAGYAFEGVFDAMHYEGVGLFDPATGTLSLSFRGEQGDAGVTVLHVEGDVLRGRWLYMDDPKGGSGTETWTWQGPGE